MFPGAAGPRLRPCFSLARSLLGIIPMAVRGPLPNRHRWVAVSAGLVLLLLAHPAREAVVAHETSLAGAPVALDEEVREHIEAILTGANPRLGSVTTRRIADAVMRCDEQYGLNPYLVVSVMHVESNMRPHARSPKGAIGLMQVMPYMYRALDLPGSVAHLEANIEAGCILLAENIERRGLENGISAYFWGRKIRGDGYLRKVKSVLQELEPDTTAPRG